MHFLKFETDKIGDCIDFMHRLQQKQQKLNGSKPSELCVMATGGGAFKYYEDIKQALRVEVLREDEMECLIIGTVFILRNKESDRTKGVPSRPRLLHH